MCIEAMRIQRSICGALSLSGSMFLLKIQHLVRYTCFLFSRHFPGQGGREGKIDTRWALKGQVEKEGKNIPGEEGAEAKPHLVVVRDAWPLLWGT